MTSARRLSREAGTIDVFDHVIEITSTFAQRMAVKGYQPTIFSLR